MNRFNLKVQEITYLFFPRHNHIIYEFGVKTKSEPLCVCLCVSGVMSVNIGRGHTTND